MVFTHLPPHPTLLLITNWVDKSVSKVTCPVPWAWLVVTSGHLERLTVWWNYAFLIIFIFLACGILVPWPGIEPVPSALGAPSCNQLTTREVPAVLLADGRAASERTSLSRLPRRPGPGRLRRQPCYVGLMAPSSVSPGNCLLRAPWVLGGRASRVAGRRPRSPEAAACLAGGPLPNCCLPLT